MKAPVTPLSKEECIEAHLGSQQAQLDGRLIKSHQLANRCSNPTCPDMVTEECRLLVKALKQRIPSVVFRVRVDGEPVTSAEIEVDGKPIERWNARDALWLDPGRHSIIFTVEQHAPVLQSTLLAEGDQFREVTCDIESEPGSMIRAPSAEATEVPLAALRSERPVPMMVYPLLGLGVLGLGAFGGFMLSGKAEHDRLAEACAPTCTDEEIRPMRSRYVIANISLGIGVAALAGAGVWYLARPVRTLQPTVGLATSPQGAMASLAWQAF